MSHGCNEVACSDSDRWQLCVDCWNRERMRLVRTRDPFAALRPCPRRCQGDICAAARRGATVGGNTHIELAPPGACAMFGGPVPEELRRAS